MPSPVSSPEQPARAGVPSAGACHRIFAAVAAARRTRAPTGELRDAVYACVRELKENGQPPEQVVRAVKALTAEAGAARSSAMRHSHWPQGERFKEDIVEAVVRWCIEAYYDVRVEPRSATAS